MSIIRNHINFSSNFVQIPNDWMRDARLSHRARGILAEVMTHSDGWEITVQHLVRNGTEGREAVRTAIKELVEFGYLRQERPQDEHGRMLGSQYTIQIPPDDIVNEYRETDSRGTGKPSAQESPTKNTNPKEDHPLEHSSGSASRDSPDSDPKFIEFYKTYPKHKDRKPAFRAWKAAVKRNDPDSIIRSAEIYALDCKVNNVEERYMKNAATWLNADAWTDYTEANAPKVTTVSLSWADAL